MGKSAILWKGGFNGSSFFHQHDARLIHSPTASVEVSVFKSGYFSTYGDLSYAQRVELPLDLMNMHAIPAEGEAFLLEYL